MIQMQRIFITFNTVMYYIYAMGRFRGNCPIYMYMHVHTHMGQRKHGSFQML